jgi:Electron transfer DM13
MKSPSRLILVGLVLVIAGAAITFPLWRPLFINDVVNEAFPGISAEEQAAFNEMATANPTMAAEMVKSALEPTVAAPADEQSMPEGDAPTSINSGAFVEIDVIHGAEGTATIYQLADESRLLRFENFRSTNGPDLHVILSSAEAPRNHDELGEDYIDLGKLKGNVGNQNYEIAPEVDLSQYKSVVIYCLPFQVVFSTATLS